MKMKILDAPEGGTTAVTAAKSSTWAAQGMGGVGKTLLAAQAIRDPEVGAAFDRLLWVSVSQDPDVLSLIKVLHMQVASTKLPADVEEERDAVQILREAAKGVKALLVLDDCWEAKHVELLNCVDVGVGSQCVITTRIRNLASKEVSCGLLSQEEAIALMLRSAGLDNLIKNPPPAALEAVEACGRLALALPIAGGMIRELEGVWEVELVAILKEELSSELSVEERIVNASLRCVDKSQRAGVEALFLVFGCFAEDEVVPVAVLDVIAPLVCERAGVDGSKLHLKVRKWLQLMLKASLLCGSVAKGVSVHDLVRDVMIARANAADGGMVGLQRHALRLMLAAHDAALHNEGETAATLAAFIPRALRHHMLLAKQPNVPLRDDDLLMSTLTGDNSSAIIRTQAVRAVGIETLKEEIRQSEATGRWYVAAQLWYAAANFRGSNGGAELKSAWSAIKQLQPETEASRILETRIPTNIIFIPKGGFTFGGAEHNQAIARLEALGAAVEVTDSTDSKDYKAIISLIVTSYFSALATIGISSHVDLNQVGSAHPACSRLRKRLRSYTDPAGPTLRTLT